MGDWIVNGKLYACRYPRTESDWDTLANHGVTTIVNLHAEPHETHTLGNYRFDQLHMYVPNFQPPTVDQMREVLALLDDPTKVVAIHCLAGLGRTGTVAACYMVSSQGMSARQAIDHVRRCRPGSIESKAQVRFVETFASKE